MSPRAASASDDGGVLFPRRGILFPSGGDRGVPIPSQPTPAPPPAPAPAGDPSNPRWAVAYRVSDALRARYGAYLQAVGLQGAVAHGDDSEISDVEIIVVTRRANSGPAPVTRRVDGVIVDLAVITADEYLRHARTLTTSWPLVADQYLTTKGLHDPEAWLPRLRDTHLAHLARADGQLFATLAREAWCRATIAHGKARLMAEWYETDAALVVLAETRVAVAVVEGLLTRTYFRNSADAVRRAGVAGAHTQELGQRLATQANELARRGRPVDGDLADLLGPR